MSACCPECGGFGLVVTSHKVYEGDRRVYDTHEYYCDQCPAGPALEAADKKKANTAATVLTW